MEFNFKITLVILLTIFVFKSSCKEVSKRATCFTCCNCGNVGPNDPYFIAGRKAGLWCELDRDFNLTADKVFFLRGNEQFSYTSTLSENKKRLEIEFYIDDPQKFIGTYYCLINKTSSLHLKLRSTVVGRQAVRIERPLRNITNLECRIYRPNEEMKCTWDFNQDNYYQNENDIDVNVTGFNGKFHNCPQLLDKHECRWNVFGSSAGHIPVDVGQWQVNVTVKNRKNNSSLTSSLVFDSADVTYFEPVSRQMVKVNADGCFVFSFDASLPKTAQNTPKVKIAYHNKEFIFDYNRTTSQSPPICDVLPFIHYNVSIQVKVSWLKLWGQPVYIEAFDSEFPKSLSVQRKIWKYIENGDFQLDAPISNSNSTSKYSTSAGIGVGTL